MIKEFKEFALKGNMLDLAIGVIIGGAFGTIVTSLVNDLIMPLLSVFTKNINFSQMYIAMNGKKYATLDAAIAEGAVFKYGAFIQQFINFIIIAFVIFLFVKQINKFKKPAAVTTKECPHCLSKINIKATKCPSCTADIPDATESEILL